MDPLERLETKIDKLGENVDGLREVVTAQSINCARVCGAQAEINRAVIERVDGLASDLREERKRVNVLAGANTVLAALGSILATLFGR